MDFINLDRDFAPLTKDQEPSLDIGRFWGAHYSGWLSWEELRRRRRIILLAEAASGKTEEFRHQYETLQAAGRPAFFLRIEELADQGTETSLDSESATLFAAWLGGSGEGWFFLDSVDEARLNRKSFDSALKRFAKDVGTGLERAHVYVSCRVTDWKGADDRTTYSRYLPAWKKPVMPPVAKPDDYSTLLDPLFEKRETHPTFKVDETEDSLNELLVVQLVPLSTEQYRTLATAAGVTGVDAFVQAIAKHGLESLTERPGDLLDLADYWNSHGKFGTFAEMLEHGVVRKLTERDPHRPDNETISPEDAREGAERLAAALTFGKSFTLRAPGHDPDPSLAAGASTRRIFSRTGPMAGEMHCYAAAFLRPPLMAESAFIIAGHRNILQQAGLTASSATIAHAPKYFSFSLQNATGARPSSRPCGPRPRGYRCGTRISGTKLFVANL
ncbi:MAG TPA: hypothetical protein VLO30_01285 [Chthoniobacterales bacterium]|nr:hypothetical protein [Chthoniobacterales bacterium]